MARKKRRPQDPAYKLLKAEAERLGPAERANLIVAAWAYIVAMRTGAPRKRRRSAATQDDREGLQD